MANGLNGALTMIVLFLLMVFGISPGQENVTIQLQALEALIVMENQMKILNVILFMANGRNGQLVKEIVL